MSFRSRLLVFFTIIVVVPMIGVGLVLFSLTSDSEHGKVDARLAGGLRTTLGFYEEARLDARRSLERIARDDVVRGALRAGDRDATARRLRELVARSPTIEAAAYYMPNGSLRAAVGEAVPVAAAGATPTTSDGEQLGTITVSTISAAELARRSARFSGIDVRILRGDAVLATTIRGAREPEAESGDIEVGGEEYRARSEEFREPAGPPTEI